jgi:hypothetical protein
MLVNRGELSPDPIGPARRRELEELQRAAASRQPSQAQAPAAEGPGDLRQRALVAQRYVARAQTVLAGLEGFRDYLLGEPQGEQEALKAILRARYQGEPVLETHRETLLRIAARGDLPLLDRWIATVRETVAGVAGDLDRREAGQPGAGSLQELLEGIRRSGEGLEKLQRENVLKLLA